MTHWKCFGATVVLALSQLGCDANVQDCERARLELSQSWNSVRESAVKRKLGGVDVGSWDMVANKADLLRSAFMTKQVTWDSADQALGYIESALSSLQSTNPVLLGAFRNTFQKAANNQSKYAEQCR